MKRFLSFLCCRRFVSVSVPVLGHLVAGADAPKVPVRPPEEKDPLPRLGLDGARPHPRDHRLHDVSVDRQPQRPPPLRQKQWALVAALHRRRRGDAQDCRLRHRLLLTPTRAPGQISQVSIDKHTRDRRDQVF